jgi:hypothetical protein|tara:strand:- start:1872 stop:2213 length:342 start_codon:yes stop_codon:yes gene_type:complete
MSSILKVDSIEERTSGGGVSFTGTLIPDALRLASKTTAERNLLSASTGDMLFNTDTAVIEFYNGSSWAGIDTLLTLVDEDDMASNSASSVPSQQSVKAYADTKASIGLVIALS